jgi:hypothetical protein
MVVYPVRSEKRTVTCFRSLSKGATSLEDFLLEGRDGRFSYSDFCSEISLAGIRLWPHSPQNLKLSGLSELQLGQSLSNLAPHSPQKLIPAGFSN